MRRLWLSALLILAGSPLLAAEPSKFTLSQAGSAGNVSASSSEVCTDNQILRANGTAPTAIQCSVLTVADTTGNLTGPSGGFSIIGGTGAGDSLTLDGSAGTAGSVSVSAAGAMTFAGGIPAPTLSGNATIGGLQVTNGISTDYFIISTTTSNAIGHYVAAKYTDELRNSILSLNSSGAVKFSDDASNVTGANMDTGIARSAAGALKVTNGSTGIGALLYAKKVTADTDGETTTAVQSGTLWTNTGDADGESITLLNDPTVGVSYCFAVDAAQTLTILPSTGESLYYGTDQCVVSLTSNSAGSTLCVTAVVGGSGGKWFTMSHEGTWACNDA